MTKTFSGEVALITGAASGIGLSTAHEFARKGARVMLADLDAQAGSRVVDELVDAGYDAAFRVCDVSNEEDVAALVGETLDRWGQLNHAFNNAGTATAHAPFETVSAEQWNRILAVNLTGVFYCMRHQVEAMRSSGGNIVNNASAAGLRGSLGLAAYSASKHGVVGLTKSAALDAGPLGIRINAVCPGAIDTPLLQRSYSQPALEKLAAATPLRRLGKADDVSALVVWLCTPAAGFLTGAALPIDGGVTI